MIDYQPSVALGQKIERLIHMKCKLESESPYKLTFQLFLWFDCVEITKLVTLYEQGGLGDGLANKTSLNIIC